jgi:hypothetical protein
MKIFLTSAMLLAVISFAAPGASLGITLGQIDTFESGTTLSWISAGDLVDPGGPAGNSDHYLVVKSGQSGADTRMQAFNQSQWLGNYLSAGVTGIAMDLNNDTFSAALQIRLAIGDQANGSNTTPGYASTNAFTLPNDNQWHHAIFLLDAGSLTAINSPKSLATDLANIVNLRVLSSALPSTNGDEVDFGYLGIDNIQAVPEPSSICLIAFAIFGIALGSWRKFNCD